MTIPILEMQLGKNANLVIPSQEQDIVTALTATGSTYTDVVVISHGWNNDMDDARTLYRDFFRAFEQVFPAAVNNTMAIGVLWPSKKFADTDLIPGGAAAADSSPVADGVLLDRLQDLKHVFGDSQTDTQIDQLKALVIGLSTDPSKQNQFVSILGAILDRHSDPAQLSPDEGAMTISQKAQQKGGGAALLTNFGRPVMPKATLGAGGATTIGSFAGNPALHPGGLGAAAGLGDFFSGIKAGALRLINYTTFYAMKDRAGKMGRDAMNPLLQRIQQVVPNSLRFHFVGHSFGGRLLTATADGPNALRIQSLLLLQAAYSHNGLAANFADSSEPAKSGFFHNVFDKRKVKGQILITHSKNDRAVGLAYPLAARLNGDDAAAVGDATDRFGGMGANGAQRIDKAELKLLPVNQTYNFITPGKLVFNLNSDSIIQSHGDVARPETAAVLAAAMKTAPQVAAASGLGLA